MSRTCIFTGIGITLLICAAYADEPAASSGGKKYTLQYKFKAGETLYWEVAHRAKIRITAGGTTKVVETASDSVKVWQVNEVNAQGETTFVHSVSSVTMRHSSAGREETLVELPPPPGKQVPLGYETAAADVGVPLTRITMDARGNVTRREDLRQRKRPSTSGYEGPLTIPLPSQPLAVGEKWTNEHVVSAPRKDGKGPDGKPILTYKQVKLEQRFTLQSVRNNIAAIYVESVILTPVREPEIKLHLVQSKTRGTVKFDIAAGRVVEQDLSLDEDIIGVPHGDASSTHYVTQFNEKYRSEPPKTARREKSAKAAQ